MSKKELLERIKSLEDFLGVKYSKGDLKDDFDEHLTYRFGLMQDIEELLKKNKKK